MCNSFNRHIGFGLPLDAPAIIQDFEELQARPKKYEVPPKWAEQVLQGKELIEKVFIPNAKGITLDEEDEDVCKEFKDVDVIVRMPHIHFM